jgi:hypothetical protein
MAVRVQAPPLAIEADLLERREYEDAFAIAVPYEQPPGAWARSILDAAPPALLWFIRTAQKALLGLDLARADEAHPLGWTIFREDAGSIVLAAEGPGGEARIFGTTPPGRVVVTTQARFDGRRSRAMWRVLAPVHRRIVPFLLENAMGKAAARAARVPPSFT